jgi:hypothetical protein
MGRQHSQSRPSPNLPGGCFVEVPAVVSSWGTQGLSVGALPEGIAALLGTQVAVQELVVEAATTGDRRIALQALLADPVVQSAKAAERSLSRSAPMLGGNDRDDQSPATRRWPYRPAKARRPVHPTRR